MSELVSKTPSAIAVTEALTTLIDWISIEAVSGFTIVINNAGGGSANDITDVTIDTSSDGGLTSDLDQHAGVPAVPIASGAAAQGTFTETASHIRVRAKCAAGEDTTVTAILTADSVVARICTLADVKDRLGKSDTESDVTINRIIAGISDYFDGFCQRQLIQPAAAVTEYYTGLSSFLQLNRYPIISVTSIKQAIDYNFDDATALTENTDYRIMAAGKKGVLHRTLRVPWFDVPDSIQVIYRGGFCSAGQAPGDGETAMPADLREAAIEQVTFVFKRKDDIGLLGVGGPGGDITKFSAMKLLPLVEQTLKRYVKPSL